MKKNSLLKRKTFLKFNNILILILIISCLMTGVVKAETIQDSGEDGEDSLNNQLANSTISGLPAGMEKISDETRKKSYTETGNDTDSTYVFKFVKNSGGVEAKIYATLLDGKTTNDNGDTVYYIKDINSDTDFTGFQKDFQQQYGGISSEKANDYLIPFVVVDSSGNATIHYGIADESNKYDYKKNPNEVTDDYFGDETIKKLAYNSADTSSTKETYGNSSASKTNRQNLSNSVQPVAQAINGINTNGSSGDSLLEESLDGLMGVLLLPVKFIMLLFGFIIKLILSLFNDGGSGLISVDDIIFGNGVGLTNINFFDISSGAGGSTMQTLREGVAKWYVGLRNLSIVILALICIYVGIRMAMATVAQEKAKYKNMLVDWITSVCLLFVLQYIMIAIISMNDTIISVLNSVRASTSGLSDASSTLATESMTSFKFSIGMGNAIAYVMLQAMTFAFLISYIKRMITIGFLVIISPLITITYSLDKMGDGKSQALNNWFKEFTYNVLIQPFHCITYLALVSTSITLFTDAKDTNDRLKRATVAICLLFFMAKSAEEIVKKIFHFESHSMPSVAENAALGYGISKAFIESGKKKSGGKGGSDSEESGGSKEKDKAPKTKDTKISEKNKKNEKDAEGKPGNKKSKGSRVGQGLLKAGAKAGKYAVAANKAALGIGMGIALGGATGEDKTLAGATMLLGGMGIESGAKDINKMKTNELRKKAAKGYNDFKSETGLSDEEVAQIGKDLLTGNKVAETEAEKKYLRKLQRLQKKYQRNGMDKEKSIKAVSKDIDGISQGKISETYSPTRYFGSLKNQLKGYFKDEWEWFTDDPDEDEASRQNRKMEKKKKDKK